MDDKYFWLVVSIVISCGVCFLVGGLLDRDVPTGFWTVMGSVVALVTLIVNRQVNSNRAEPEEKMGD